MTYEEPVLYSTCRTSGLLRKQSGKNIKIVLFQTFHLGLDLYCGWHDDAVFTLEAYLCLLKWAIYVLVICFGDGNGIGRKRLLSLSLSTVPEQRVFSLHWKAEQWDFFHFAVSRPPALWEQQPPPGEGQVRVRWGEVRVRWGSGEGQVRVR